MIGFLGVASVLVGVAFLYLDNHRRRLPPFLFASPEPNRWSLPQLLGASFLTMFAELAFIRWIGIEVRVFAYFKNLALLLCFLGFGMGCALAKRPLRWLGAVTATLGLLLLIRLPLPSWKGSLEGLSISLGSAGDMEIWKTGLKWSWASFGRGSIVACVLLFCLASIFIPLGQLVSRQIDLAPRRLSAYSWNLLGSLAGILGFFAVSQAMLPPTFWFAVVLFGFALLQGRRSHAVMIASLVLPAIAVLRDAQTHDFFVTWTPYQQIEFSRIYFRSGQPCGANIRVNHTGYQLIANLSPEFLRSHSGLLREAVEENPYNVGFRFALPSPRVLIVGSGAGNDVAAALRHGASAVDAVEIDPAIWQLGLREHPEHPYDSPRVSVYLTDARAFLKRTTRKYDLIMFGLLDSHTQFSDYSNMRIDNFVYTQESFLEAKQHLAENGVLFVKFEVNRSWMGKRLLELLTSTFGKAPAVFFADSSFTPSATCFAISASGQVDSALAKDVRLAKFVNRPLDFLNSPEVPITTDDWPYLYHQGKWIPRTYYSIALLVMLVALAFYVQIPEARGQRPSLFFFGMGAGFLLLETQVISRLALYFGTTWQVNGIVIAAVLTALVGANTVAERWPSVLKRQRIVIGLLAGLSAAYVLPLNRIPAPPAIAGTAAALVFSVPVFFAGLLFSREFANIESPTAALAANMLGAVVGGLLENLSLVFGMRWLLLAAFGLYCLAALGLRSRGAVTSKVYETVAA